MSLLFYYKIILSKNIFIFNIFMAENLKVDLDIHAKN